MLQKKDLITLGDLRIEEIWIWFHIMRKIKMERGRAFESGKEYLPFYQDTLKGISSYSLFNYPSMRTIGSYVVALNEMGACPNYHFNENDLPRAYSHEKASHIGKILGGSEVPWFQLAYVRFHGPDGDQFIRELAEYSKIPVINAMTKKHHPLQGIADIFTLLEEWHYFDGASVNDRQITYFGLGNNNITHSLMLAAAATGINFLLICPDQEHCFPAEDVLMKAQSFARQSGSMISINESEKIENTDAVVTDTHDIGDTPLEKQMNKKVLEPYTVNEEKTLSFKKNNWIFLHCMPIHMKRGGSDYQEVSQTIADGPQSRIFQEADNRLYSIMAYLYAIKEKMF